MTLSAWRPLKDAPAEGAILVRLTSGEVARATAAVITVGASRGGGDPGWQEAVWVDDSGQVIPDASIAGWRPEACILHTGQACACAACLADQWEYAPIADTYELDRAVQVKIAEAFGALIDVLVQNEHAIDPYDDGGSSDCCDAHVTWAIQDVRRILHTSMGGRIPDEVP